MGEVMQGLGRVEGKLDAAIASASRAHGRLDDHDKRLGSLEVNQGKIVLLGGIGATLIPIIVMIALKHWGYA